MKNYSFCKNFLIFLFFGLININGIAKTNIKIKDLICEYHTNPIGIDIQKPRLSWKLESTDENVLQSAYEIRVTDQPAKGKTIWTSGKVESEQSINVEYGGPALKSMQRVYWQVRVWDNQKRVSDWCAPAFWEMGILSPEEWKALWIEIPFVSDIKGSKPCQYFRKEFVTTKAIKSARVYITSHGLYQLFLNGQKVSNDLFTPGWTSYSKRLQYQTYDVTSLIKSKNAIGAILGDGWYRGMGLHYGDKLALLVQLQISYADGTSELIGTNHNWKVTNNGPVLESDIFDGETYDARKEIPDWENTGFDDRQWENALVAEYPRNILVAPRGEIVKVIEEIKPIKMITTPKGEIVFDLGQNMTGWARLKVQGNKGDKITLRFAEVLDNDGNFYTDNLRMAKATDVYILKGYGMETFEPHFTYHGFRYVKIEGISGQPSLDQIIGVVVHSDIKPTGSFTCSEPLINQLQHNIQWSQRDNFLDVPTDCPQRDERIGWIGDIQVFSMTGTFNFNVASFYTKWLCDLSVDQLPNGKIPYKIPDVENGHGGTAAWGDAAVIVPWTTYLAYGDRRILEIQYQSMKGWVEYMKNKAGDNLIWSKDYPMGDWLANRFNWDDDIQIGDWLSYNSTWPAGWKVHIRHANSIEERDFTSTYPAYPAATTEIDLIATAYFAHSSGLLAKIAAIIGQTEDAKKYTLLSENIKKAFQKEYLTQVGRLVSNTQTAYSLSLAFNLLPDEFVPKAAAFLADDVRKMGHLTTGFVGTPLLCKALSANGYDSLAFRLVNRKEYPSWLYPVTKGATTIWERWDGIKPDGTFQDPGMNSFNHYALGAIGEWMYQYIAGISIDTENPGYKHILLSPHPGGGLTHAEAELITLYGKIKSAWKLDNNFIYEVTIPANTTATVTLPGAKVDQFVVNKKPVTASVKESMKQSGTGIALNMGSGTYTFRYLRE
jgi:alpha-L-rhamnosidase